MEPNHIHQFFGSLKRSGLVPEEKLQSYSDEFRASGVSSQEEIAAQLVERNVLTAWQAERILLGQGEDCILAGRYHILDKIGAGGMGNVFRARDTELDRIVAIKVMAAHNLSDADAVVRFKREARALAQLALPNVVQAFDSGEDHGRNFLVMEYVQGSGLNDLVKQKGPVPPTVAADYIYQAAIAMQRAHERGMIHRDIKPGNMVLSSDGQVKILDLGLAKFLQDQIPDSEVTRDNIGLGTPDYMPPEQFRDARNVDPRADIYSLGCTLYYLIAGQVPFPGSSFSEKAHAHETKQPIPLEEHCPQVPAGLSLAVEKMMAKRPADRYQTMHDAAQALAPYVAGSSPSLPSVKMTVSFIDSQVTRSRRRGKWMAWITGGAVVVAAIAVLAVLLPGFFGSPSPTLPDNGKQASADDKGKKAKTEKADQKKKTDKTKLTKPKKITIPNGLTVAQDGSGDCKTINEALAKIKPGQTIRILDNGVYPENVVIEHKGKYAGITLEATGDAVVEVSAKTGFVIRNVPDVTVRGLHIRSDSTFFLVHIENACPHTRLERLKLTGPVIGINIEMAKLSDEEPPIEIHGCHIKTDFIGIRMSGFDARFLTPLPTGRVVAADNLIEGSRMGFYASGELYHLQLFGNRIVGCSESALRIVAVFPKSHDVLIANNTMLNCERALEIHDEVGKTKSGEAITIQNGKRFQISNNLVLSPGGSDMTYVAAGALANRVVGPRDGASVPKLWTISHNWRESKKPAPDDTYSKGWIPPNEKDADVLTDKIAVLSRTSGDGQFLQPAADSPLATEGAGKTDPSLPAYVGAVPPKNVKPWNWKWTWDAHFNKTLTVSKDPKDEARFDTINAALEKVKPGMTVRVVDKAVYRKPINLNRKSQFEGITLEALNNATIEPHGSVVGIGIRNVPKVTIRGFVLRAATPKSYMVGIFESPGCKLTGLTIERKPGIAYVGIGVEQNSAQTDFPIIVENCRIDGAARGIRISGISDDGKTPLATGHISIRNNRINSAQHGIKVQGLARQVHIVGNIIRDSQYNGVHLEALSANSEDILVANNTILACDKALVLWDTGVNGKNVSITNNLILEQPEGDMGFADGLFGAVVPRGPQKPHLITKLHKAWNISYNWRETKKPTDNSLFAKSWIPPGRNSCVKENISVLSRIPGDPNFLRPAKDSPLATEGAGKTDPSLPVYVGAVPPEGVEPWDWDRTWQILTTNTLTVSKKPEDGGMFRTIGDALQKVKPRMTVRVLDDAVYNETLILKDKEKLNGITLEAAKKAIIESDKGHLLDIGGIHDLTLRGFKLRTKVKEGVLGTIRIWSDSPGLLIEDVEFESLQNHENTGIAIPGDFRRASDGKPMIIKACTFKNFKAGVFLQGFDESGKVALPVERTMVTGSLFLDCNYAVMVKGACRDIYVTGNRIINATDIGIQLEHLMKPTKNVIVANNTVLGGNISFRVWEMNERVKGKDAKEREIGVYNNLFLSPNGPDMVFLDSGGDALRFKGPGDVAALVKSWRFKCNWRETKPFLGNDQVSKAWIPPNKAGKDVVAHNIPVRSRDPSDATFLQPAKDSPLAKAGLGKDGLPPYVGAVPPAGVEPWDWDRTWQERITKKKTAQ